MWNVVFVPDPASFRYSLTHRKITAHINTDINTVKITSLIKGQV